MALATVGSNNIYYFSANSTTETVITNVPAILIGVTVDGNAATTGTVTLRDQATAAGGTTTVVSGGIVPVGGKDFFGGVRLNAGLTVQKATGTDVVGIVWAPFHA